MSVRGRWNGPYSTYNIQMKYIFIAIITYSKLSLQNVTVREDLLILISGTITIPLQEVGLPLVKIIINQSPLGKSTIQRTSQWESPPCPTKTSPMQTWSKWPSRPITNKWCTPAMITTQFLWMFQRKDVLTCDQQYIKRHFDAVTFVTYCVSYMSQKSMPKYLCVWLVTLFTYTISKNCSLSIRIILFFVWLNHQILFSL